MAQKLLGNLPKGIIFVLSAPAGTGKTTLVTMLRDEFVSVAESISSTTRPIRAGEVEGEHYHFLGESEFEQKVKAGDFLEHAKVFNYSYGTSREAVLRQQTQGKHVFLVIDTQGALQLKGKIPAVFIFIRPPSLQELRERLFKRQTESEEAIAERLSWAQKEMEAAPHYDYEIVNENLLMAYDILRSIVIAEEHKVKKVLC